MNMLLLVAGNGDYAGFLVGMFLMGALAFLAFKKGFGTLGTFIMLYPTAVALALGGWVPQLLVGGTLLGIGILWGIAIIKLFGTPIGEGSDVQKIFIVALCWNSLLLFAYPQNATADMIARSASTNPATSIVIDVINFLTLGGIMTFVSNAGLENQYLIVLRLPLIAIGALAVYPLIFKLIAVFSQISLKTAVIGVVGFGFVLVVFWRMLGF